MGSFKYLKIPEEEYRRASEFDRRVYKNIPLVAKIVGEASNNSKLDQDDLFQIGLEALVEAVQKFDPAKNRALSTFVGVVVKNRIYYNIKINKYDVKVAYGTAKKVREVEKIAKNQKEGEEKSIGEIVSKMRVSKSTANMIINLYNYSSLELTDHNKNGRKEQIALNHNFYDGKTDTTTINNIIDFIISMVSLLPALQAAILVLRLGFYDGHTHPASEVGLFLNKNEEAVRELEVKAIHHLRDSKFLKVRYENKTLSDPWLLINNRIELNNSIIDRMQKNQ